MCYRRWQNQSTTIAQGKPISEDTIKRMYSYLSRAEEYYKPEDNKACGTISYLLWGGLAGKRWSEAKLKELGHLELYSEKVFLEHMNKVFGML